MNLGTRERWTAVPCPLFGYDRYRWRNLQVMVGEDPALGWHLSIACPDRWPTYDELQAARFELVPHDVTMALLLPPGGVNGHVFLLHLWQVASDSDS